jgi:AraC-like DNA-binding protein
MQATDVTSSAAWLRGVVHIFAAQGIATDRLFADAGVDVARLKQPHQRFGNAEINRVWQLALERSGLPNLALDRQLAGRHINFNIAAQAMWPGRDLGAGLQSLSRYLHLIGDAATFDMHPVLEGAWMQLAHGKDAGTPRQRVEFGMLTLLLLCRRVTRQPVRALAVEFTFPDPPDLHAYLMAFASPLRFGQSENRMLFANGDLALPLANTATSMFALHEQVIEERLARLPRAHASWRAAEEIVRNLHLGEPSPREVARALGLTEDAMQRKLKGERTSFDKLLDEVRQELAGHYLAAHDFALARIPVLLGYTSAAQFAADCKRWFRMPPAQYRQLMAGDDSHAA